MQAAYHKQNTEVESHSKNEAVLELSLASLVSGLPALQHAPRVTQPGYYLLATQRLKLLSQLSKVNGFRTYPSFSEPPTRSMLCSPHLYPPSLRSLLTTPSHQDSRLQGLRSLPTSP